MRRKRPALPKRYDVFSELRESIHALEIAYEQTGNAFVLKSLRIQQRLMNMFEAREVLYRQQEIDEALAMLPELPHAVRTWLLYYREQELAL